MGRKFIKTFGVLFLLVFVLTSSDHFIGQYYKLKNSPLLPFSTNGLQALALYELGQYRKASQAWPDHYGLSNDSNLMEILKTALRKPIEAHPHKIDNSLRLADVDFPLADYPNATITYHSALPKNKNICDAQFGLASSLAVEGKHRQSQAVFEDIFNQTHEENNITGFPRQPREIKYPKQKGSIRDVGVCLSVLEHNGQQEIRGSNRLCRQGVFNQEEPQLPSAA